MIFKYLESMNRDEHKKFAENEVLKHINNEGACSIVSRKEVGSRWVHVPNLISA
jgi:hypothetical protein